MSSPFGVSVFDRGAFTEGKTMSRVSFNALMGLVLCWGFAVNAVASSCWLC
ncbi:MAG: hypothetical protein PUD81_06430 [Eggerthellales bacterium]|nr:hypothetical protein [Eggerthellales bacterium]